MRLNVHNGEMHHMGENEVHSELEDIAKERSREETNKLFSDQNLHTITEESN